MTDFRALCAELVEELAAETSLYPGHEREIVTRARAALAEPKPEGPTDEELRQLRREREWPVVDSVLFAITRAVLARWGNHPGFPDSSPQPFPVSGRLPGSEDCNSEGEVWAWRRFDPEGCMDNGDFWCLAYHEWLEDEDCGFTHWLPAYVLPLP